MAERQTQIQSLLQSLINAAEKASNIARICRSDCQLLELLVQEKSSGEANTRFAHDFKTLADVLIQETIRHDVGALFPELQDAIKGEETACFTNALGESITVEVGETPEATASSLAFVLNGKIAAAEALATEVHRDVHAKLGVHELPELPPDLNYGQLGIWIDPIDATAEYISGDSIFTNFPGITSTGLDCVTVLIGVYELSTGVPVIGVVSQPFHAKISENDYKSQIWWGIALPKLHANNCESLLERVERVPHLGIFSSSEDSNILQHMLELGYEFAFSAGAGHKALKIITNDADVYLLSKGSTFKWDTCAPQAILRSLGGNIYDFHESLKSKKPITLNYTIKAKKCENVEHNWKCNNGGIIAVRDTTLLEPILQKLSEVMH